MSRLAAFLHALLLAITIGLLLALAGIVVAAVVARYVFNASFIWYDEVASVLLAWITFYGAAFAALRRRHLGFPGAVLSAPPALRALLFVFGELVVYAVFLVLAYGGWIILGIMGSETLVSLRWVTLAFTQSALPIGALLFVLAQAVSTPEAWRQIMSGRSAEDEEIAEEIARAQASGPSAAPTIHPTGGAT